MIPLLLVCTLAVGLDAPDPRLTRERFTDTVFAMPDFASREAWELEKETIRRRMLVGSGLYPFPEKTPLKARVFDRIQHEDYSVEKVHFEAWPGFFVTGNLYRPVGEGPFPGVINPHGHWEHGRLEDNDDRGSVPARCITLARMGMVAFSYDMLGYNDSKQFEHRWYEKELALWGIHPFALQLWASIRALDFLESLPDVDQERLACTGASGGGTQTFALYAVDDRLKVAAPVNMISSTMQGGCVCENAPLIRLSHSNMEIGATFAPKPLLLVSATGDWTRLTPTVEYPGIRAVYALYDATSNVENVHIDAGHNYNQASREAMYRFFGKHLLPERDWTAFTEPAYTVEPDERLRVFPDGLPASAPGREEIIASLQNSTRERLLNLARQGDKQEFAAILTDTLGGPLSGAIELEQGEVRELENFTAAEWTLLRREAGQIVRGTFYRGAGAAAGETVLLVHGEGRPALQEGAGPGTLISRLVAGGLSVFSIDAFGTAASAGKRIQKAFPDTFVPSDTACRVQDVLTAATFLRSRAEGAQRVHLAGIGEAGLWVLLAAALDGGPGKVIADLQATPLDDARWVEKFYIPCIQAVGGLGTALALLEPRPIEAGHNLDLPKLTILRPYEAFRSEARETTGDDGWIHTPDTGDIEEAVASTLLLRAAFQPAAVSE